MNSLHRVLCDAKHALWHVLSECSQGGKHVAGSNYIILLVLLLLLGASSSPWRSVLFGHETDVHHNRSSLKAFSSMSNAMKIAQKYGAISDSPLLKMEWKNNKPVFQIHHTTRITGIRG
ncbi:MAG: hypothetical protein ACTJHW_14795 [Paenalcaligenes sp.]